MPFFPQVYGSNISTFKRVYICICKKNIYIYINPGMVTSQTPSLKCIYIYIYGVTTFKLPAPFPSPRKRPKEKERPRLQRGSQSPWPVHRFHWPMIQCRFGPLLLLLASEKAVDFFGAGLQSTIPGDGLILMVGFTHREFLLAWFFGE